MSERVTRRTVNQLCEAADAASAAMWAAIESRAPQEEINRLSGLHDQAETSALRAIRALWDAGLLDGPRP